MLSCHLLRLIIWMTPGSERDLPSFPDPNISSYRDQDPPSQAACQAMPQLVSHSKMLPTNATGPTREEANQTGELAQWWRPHCSMREASRTDSRDWGQRSKAHAKDVRHDYSIQKGSLRLRDLFPSKEPSSETQLLNALREVLQITRYLMDLNISSLANFTWKNDAIDFLTAI